jgi:aminopeptidase-like protein
MHALATELYPICRSITGDGVRRTLDILRRRIPLEVIEVPTGTTAFDWRVPREWNVRGAWIEGPDGRRVVDFADHNLHLLNYSVPVRRRLSLSELQEHLYSLPEQPKVIPYRTSYYVERWGFCLAHEVRESLPEGTYEAVVDTTLEDGHLTYGELLLRGESTDEMLISTHVCHPSLANDNLSGIAVATFLAEILGRVRHRWSYRFLFVPGTIGSITWLARNPDCPRRVRAGLVAANLGDAGGFHYKRSFRGNATIDHAVERALGAVGEDVGFEPFAPYGYDERQYSSPAFRLPIGSLTRTPYGRYPEYHTSADDLSFLRPEALGGSLAAYLAVASILDGCRRYRSTNPAGEPQLGKRGLYRTTGGSDSGRERELALLWVLSLGDGEHSLLDAAVRSGLPLERIEGAASELRAARLLTDVE